MVEITLPVVVCWMFAIRCLVSGYRDFRTIEYRGAGSGRYLKLIPFFIATLASMDAILIAYFFAHRKRLIVNVLVGLMVIIWVMWTVVARRYRRIR